MKEFQKQSALTQSAEAPGIRPLPLPNAFELETQFGIEAKSGRGGSFDRYSMNGFYRYVVGKDTIVTYQLSDSTLGENQRKLFAKFILYECKIHPSIRRELTDYGRIPSLLSYRSVKMGDSTAVRLELKSITGNPSADYMIPPGYRRQYYKMAPGDSVLGSLLLLSQAPDHQPQSEAEYAAVYRDAIQRQNYLDAHLARWEHRMQFCAESDAMRTVEVPEARDDGGPYGKFMQAMKYYENKETALKAIDLFDRIDRTGMRKGYCIDIFKAYAQRSADSYEAVMKSMYRGFEGNPYLGGVLIDMGKWFEGSYEMQYAWDCWELARRCLPEGCDLMKQVAIYEQKLINEAGEFFN